MTVTGFSSPNLSVDALASLRSPLTSEVMPSPLTYTNLLYATTLPSPTTLETPNLAKSYVTRGESTVGVQQASANMLQEQSSDQRFVRFMNPVFKYDFKVGNYMPDEAKKMNPHLMMSIKDITTGIRKSS